tara:strand:- start:484 stop:1389 length:906 start_codon:yes stop_codon:yes gene_type:complete
MKLNRKDIFKQYNWLKEKNRPFIISCDYDGIICASFLKHYLNWELVGYYDYNSIWLSDKAKQDKHKIIWVDLNILPESGKSIGGQIVSVDQNLPKGFLTSCNPNILLNLKYNDFKRKFPFSTLLFLLWLHNIKIANNDLAQLFILHSDNTWMKIQKYSKNINSWKEILSSYDWRILDNVNSLDFEQKIDQYLYPTLINIGAASKFSKLKSNFLKIRSRESEINPDWDCDVILKLFSFIAKSIGWTPPTLPLITQRIDGSKKKIDLDKVINIGINAFTKKYKVFSYAITSPKTISYTIFKKL